MIIGLLAGVLSGAVGIGGGVVLVPAMIFALGYSQQLAQGTTLALLMFPVVILGVLTYAKADNVNWTTAALLGVGFVFGGAAGAYFANAIPEQVSVFGYLVDNPLQKIFALLLIVMAVRLLLR